jgi:hypothetical protein
MRFLLVFLLCFIFLVDTPLVLAACPEATTPAATGPCNSANNCAVIDSTKNINLSYRPTEAKLGPIGEEDCGQFAVNATRFGSIEEFGILIIQFLTGTVVLVTILTFMIGSAFWIFSAGNESLVERGKDLMMYSLLGILITLGAYVIIKLFQVILYALST